MSKNNQLNLFPLDPDEHLFPYWRKSLNDWPDQAFKFRHYRNTTGWSMVLQYFSFARCLYRHGQMRKEQFRRWFRFHRKVWSYSKKMEHIGQINKTVKRYS